MAAHLRSLFAGTARGFAAGLAGTAVMTATLKLEQLARDRTSARDTVSTGGPSDEEPVDYDASSHVVTAAASVLRYQPRTDAGKRALFLLVHWGYGSAVGIAYVGLLHSQNPPDPRRATMQFYGLCQAMAMTLFPTFGDTPPPWRWARPSC